MTGEIADPRLVSRELNRDLADGGLMCKGAVDRQPYYLLVEEKAPSSYRMLDVSTTRQAGCAP